AFTGRIRPMPEHPNGMRFTARNAEGSVLLDERYISIGGGFIQALDSIETDERVPEHDPIPYPFSTGDELLAVCHANNLTIPQLMMANESALRPAEEVRAGVLHIARIMNESIDRGCGISDPVRETI